MSYYPDDLALLSWNAALLIDPDPLAVEFANVELLLLRSYDAHLDAQAPPLYRRIAAAQRRFALPLVHRSRRLLHQVQRLVVEVSMDR